VPAGDNLMLHIAIHRAPPGSVIVCAAGDSNWAMAGGNVVRLRGSSVHPGFVVDGVIRDLAENPRAPLSRLRARRDPIPACGNGGLIDVPVVCGGSPSRRRRRRRRPRRGSSSCRRAGAGDPGQAIQKGGQDAKTPLADWAKAHKARIDELTRSLGI